jgi:hypothetical protein
MRTIILPFALISLTGCSSTPPCEDRVEAFVMAQTFVTRQLRSPSTADFPLINADGVSSVPLTLPDGRCGFSVMLYVDAQNGFGATIRQNFSVTIAPDLSASNSWDLIEISSY